MKHSPRIEKLLSRLPLSLEIIGWFVPIFLLIIFIILVVFIPPVQHFIKGLFKSMFLL